jgi:hypothetical protein
VRTRVAHRSGTNGIFEGLIEAQLQRLVLSRFSNKQLWWRYFQHGIILGCTPWAESSCVLHNRKTSLMLMLHLSPGKSTPLTVDACRLEPIKLGQRLMLIPVAHHRFNYIHPFPDGNGRVSRLMSHAMVQWAGVGAHGLWSVSRGLARGLESRTEYFRMMDHADSPRQGDLDGRGNLSEKALQEFTQWFLEVCLDQVEFMSGLFDLNRLDARYD